MPGVVVPSWYGLLAPAGTPADVVEQLARDATAILAEPAVRERLQGQGLSAADAEQMQQRLRERLFAADDRHRVETYDAIAAKQPEASPQP